MAEMHLKIIKLNS